MFEYYRHTLNHLIVNIDAYIACIAIIINIFNVLGTFYIRIRIKELSDTKLLS